MRSPRRLGAWTYVVRNLGQTVPMATILVLAVMLVYGIVAMIDSIPLSIRTIYQYSRFSLGVTPRGDPTFTPRIIERFEREAPVAIDPILVIRASATEVRSIVGTFPFVVLAFEQPDMNYYLRRLRVHSIEGRLPRPGEPEALVSEPVARNLGLRLGSVLLSPSSPESYSPEEVRVCGIARSEEWIMLTSIEYHRANHTPPVDVLLVCATDPARQPELDAWAIEAFAGTRAQLFAYAKLEENTRSMFDILYKILSVVIGALVVVIALMMGMLVDIFHRRRTPEFALVQALGSTRRRLVTQVMAETTLLVVGGWAVGVLLAVGLLHLVKSSLMDPRAFLLDPADRQALLYTLPVPIVVLATAFVTVWRRFARFDPIDALERRVV